MLSFFFVWLIKIHPLFSLLTYELCHFKSWTHTLLFLFSFYFFMNLNYHYFLDSEFLWKIDSFTSFLARFFILFSSLWGYRSAGNSMIYMMVSIFSHNIQWDFFISHYATLNLFYTFSFICLVAHIFSVYFFFVPAPVYGNEVLEQYKKSSVKFLCANDLSPIQWNWNG